MAKDPVFPLYYNDIDRSTKTWTDEEFGAYMRLLMEQWDKGGLPKDYQRLTRIATSLDKNWTLLKDKFIEVDGQLKNTVLEEIRQKRDKHKEKQKENIQKRYQKSTKHDTKNLPLEDEIENEVEIKFNKKGAPSKSEIESDLFTDAVFVEQMQMTHKGKDIKQAWNECWNHHSSSPSPPRESWEWRQKLNTWLTIKNQSNGKSKNGVVKADFGKLTRLVNERHGITGAA